LDIWARGTHTTHIYDHVLHQGRSPRRANVIDQQEIKASQDRRIPMIARINLLRIICNKLEIQYVSPITLIIILPPLPI
jgi:hypothetical protein